MYIYIYAQFVSERQQKLNFKAGNPAAMKQKLDEEDLKIREEKQRKAAIKQETAEQWGLPHPTSDSLLLDSLL